jgi:hypothetical protein
LSKPLIPIPKALNSSSLSESLNSLNSSSTLAHNTTTGAFSFFAYSLTSFTYSLSSLARSSSETFDKYIIGFKVRKSNGTK